MKIYCLKCFVLHHIIIIDNIQTFNNLAKLNQLNDCAVLHDILTLTAIELRDQGLSGID